MAEGSTPSFEKAQLSQQENSVVESVTGRLFGGNKELVRKLGIDTTIRQEMFKTGDAAHAEYNGLFNAIVQLRKPENSTIVAETREPHKPSEVTYSTDMLPPGASIVWEQFIDTSDLHTRKFLNISTQFNGKTESEKFDLSPEGSSDTDGKKFVKQIQEIPTDDPYLRPHLTFRFKRESVDTIAQETQDVG